jgi:hypothetical protein
MAMFTQVGSEFPVRLKVRHEPNLSHISYRKLAPQFVPNRCLSRRNRVNDKACVLQRAH